MKTQMVRMTKMQRRLWREHLLTWLLRLRELHLGRREGAIRDERYTTGPSILTVQKHHWLLVEFSLFTVPWCMPSTHYVKLIRTYGFLI
jgi:hypothetical protein